MTLDIGHNIWDESLSVDGRSLQTTAVTVSLPRNWDGGRYQRASVRLVARKVVAGDSAESPGTWVRLVRSVECSSPTVGNHDIPG